MIGVFGKEKRRHRQAHWRSQVKTQVDIHMKSQMRGRQRDQLWSLRINAPKSREYFLLLKPPALLRVILAKQHKYYDNVSKI